MKRHQEDHWMRRALRLARPHVVAAWPNPTVGACLVKEGRLIGEGYHRAAGQPHAEREALADCRRAGEDSSGATLYVTLEPCHHHGRTPPCTTAIVEADIARVVYAAADNNPSVAGNGGAWLAAQGIEVGISRLSAIARELNHRFFETGGGSEPHVTLKLASSIDGRLARRRGRIESSAERRISGSAAHRRAHRLRAGSSAIVVGRQTVANDRPRLTARGVAARRGLAAGSDGSSSDLHRPRPIVLDSDLTLDPDILPENCLIVAAVDAPTARIERFENRAIEIALCRRAESGLDWQEILAELDRRKLGCVLVEGGAAVASTLLQQRRAHRIHLFLAPTLIGGTGAGLAEYSGEERRYTTHRVRQIGEDVEWLLVARSTTVG